MYAYQVVVNVDHESGEGTVSLTHDRAEQVYIDDDDQLIVWEGGKQVAEYSLFGVNWYMVRPYLDKAFEVTMS